ncbi:MAG: hypothetical protein AAGC60_27620 [Acidobacteriota bacterium]
MRCSSPPRATRRALQTLAVLLGLLALCGPAIALDPLPVDDHRELVEKSHVHLDRTFFLANDSASGNEKIVVVDPPQFGHLTKILDNGFVYTTDAPFLGVDSFTYRLVSGSTTSPTARVTLRFVARFHPLAGRWPTRTCNAQGCPDSCTDGEGSEIGFYDRREFTFSLCDWLGGPHLTACKLLQVPADLRPTEGGMPLMLDWDGDGWDEPALHDPSTGTVHIFSRTPVLCPVGEKKVCLEPVAHLDLATVLGAAAHHVTPFADNASETTTSSGASLAAYDSIAGLVYLGLGADGLTANSISGTPFDHGAGALAVRGAWSEPGRETLGLWSPTRRSFAYQADDTGTGVIEVELAVSDEYVAMVWPLAVPTNRCASTRLGLWSPCHGKLLFYTLEDPPGGRASVYVNVPTDPAGYPAPWPSCDAFE